MRNRFHKEPVDPNNIIRPDQAGTKENPDYVVNIQGNSKTHIESHIDTIPGNRSEVAFQNCTNVQPAA